MYGSKGKRISKKRQILNSDAKVMKKTLAGTLFGEGKIRNISRVKEEENPWMERNMIL